MHVFAKEERVFHFTEIPNLRHLRMVQVIGRMGGVCNAARELSIAQPAVTQAVGNLENKIGTPIFERCATGSFPTSMGKRYILRIDRFFDILDRAMAAVLGYTEGISDGVAPQVDRVMTNTQLRSLIVTCEKGRVSELAHNMGLTPASLFRSARSLERSLGRSLFDRTALGPIPNKTGEYLARECRRAVREIELGKGEILLVSGSVSLELIVGVLPMPGSHELVEAIQNFMAKYPSAKIRLVSGEYHKLLADLNNSRIDMMVGILRKPEWAVDVSEEFMFNDSYCVIVRREHPLSKFKKVSPEDLSCFDWVAPAIGTPRRDRIEKIFEGLSTCPRFHLETPSLTMCRSLLLGSDMITLMARSEVRQEIEHGIYAELPCEFLSGLRQPKGVTTRCDWLPTRAHEAFLDCLRAATNSKVVPNDKIELVF